MKIVDFVFALVTLAFIAHAIFGNPTIVAMFTAMMLLLLKMELSILRVLNNL